MKKGPLVVFMVQLYRNYFINLRIPIKEPEFNGVRKGPILRNVHYVLRRLVLGDGDLHGLHHELGELEDHFFHVLQQFDQRARFGFLE